MKKKHCTFWILPGVVISLLMTQFSAMAADKVVVIPLFRSGDKIPTVTSKTGRVWMDRNLGASHVAESMNDYGAYGWLFQWGRFADGHQTPFSPTTQCDTVSVDDVPGHGSFLCNNNGVYDWRDPQNPTLWQGVSGTNNPCPMGFRLPAEAEWETELASWGANPSAEDAFASPLKLVVAGYRVEQGNLQSVGTRGQYWSSTVVGDSPPGSQRLYITQGGPSGVSNSYRAEGCSVRCIKD